MGKAGNEVLKFYSDQVHELEDQMSEAQRKCLLHVLRNIASGLVGTIGLLENETSTPTRETLIDCLKSVPHMVGRVVTSLEAGSFCTLSEEECSFVGPHMGCRKADYPAKAAKS